LMDHVSIDIVVTVSVTQLTVVYLEQALTRFCSGKTTSLHSDLFSVEPTNKKVKTLLRH